MFDPGRPFHPSLFLGKSRSLSKEGAPEKRFTWEGSGLTRKHYIRLESGARNKHSSLSGLFIIYEENCVVNATPASCTSMQISDRAEKARQ